MRQLRARPMLQRDGLRLIAVEAVDRAVHRGERGGIVHAELSPVAVVVCAPDGQHAVGADAAAADLEELRRAVPGLAAMLQTDADST